MSREAWLNGWPKLNNCAVLLVGSVHCIGCGKFHGVVTVALDENSSFPDERPDWPFEESSCPVCEVVGELQNAPTALRGSFSIFEERMRQKGFLTK